MEETTSQAQPAMRVPATAAHAAAKFKRNLSKFEKTYKELAPLLKPDYVRIDYVLVHGKESSEDTEKRKIRERFEKSLAKEGFSIKRIEIDDKDAKKVQVHKTLHCSFIRLCEEAERVKLEMPLDGCENSPQARRTWITKLYEIFETEKKLNPVCAPFKMNKTNLFKDYDNPDVFFRPALRSLLTHHILNNIDTKEKEKAGCGDSPAGNGTRRAKDWKHDCCFCCPCVSLSVGNDDEDTFDQKIGLPYLLMQKVYDDAYILHDDSNEEYQYNAPKNTTNKKRETLDRDPRKELREAWCTWGAVLKFQPIWKIRNYFGEKIALYFAWAGMLLTSLWIPTVFGLACFIYGLSVSEDIQMPTNLTATEEFRWQLENLYENYGVSFDNAITPWFAFVICIWGTVFLEFWKRQNARLAYEWDVNNFEANEPDRPEFYGTKIKKDPITKENNWFYPFRRQLLKFFLSASALVLMVCVVLVLVVAVVLYRVIISVDYCGTMTTEQCFFTTTIVSALINAVCIFLFGLIYDCVALKLTDWENHRTQTEYDDALIIKLFAFQFANNYASCFYIAFFRERLEASRLFGLGDEYSETWTGGCCMPQLSFQVLILMIAKPVPKIVTDIICPCIIYGWRCCRSRFENKIDSGNQVTTEDEDTISKQRLEFLQCNYKYYPTPLDFTLPEYMEKVIMYGYFMLFAASFPLAPMILLLWLATDIRIDAKRLLWINRRPVAFIAQDIGMWYGILDFINLAGVISNGFLIAFTSEWGLKYDLTTRLWICIGFENIAFIIKFLLEYNIPDIPKKLRQATTWEKNQVFQKLENKGPIQDYTENVPKASYELILKLLENSGNYYIIDIDDLVIVQRQQ